MIQPNIQKFVSPFIQSQFPRFYSEMGPVFIQFVKAYYQWAETEGFLYDSRRIDEYLDIDTTVQDYIVYFKDKYLPNIQLNTASNTKLLIKHSLDIYRTRGTIRAIDLLFRLVFAKDAKVYYPWEDVFKTSPGQWVLPLYLEVSNSGNLDDFVGKQIVGVKSGATAFVESWTRKKKDIKTIHLFYVSTKIGEFQTNEYINIAKKPKPLKECPIMVGSLSALSIETSDVGSKIGDVVYISGDEGYGAEGIVKEVSNVTGLVSFSFNDGGYGYTDNPQVLISNNVLFLSNVNSTSNGDGMFSLFETVSQPTANIVYVGNNNFQNNDPVFAWSNAAIVGTGLVLSSIPSNSTAGQIQIYVSNGSFSGATKIYASSNAVVANISSFMDTTATGNLIAESLTFQADIIDFTDNFRLNERITEPGGAQAIVTYTATTGGLGTFYACNRIGVWKSNTTITGAVSGTTAKIININMDVGIISPNNAFVLDPRALLRGSLSNTTASVIRVSTGSNAVISFSTVLSDEETALLNTDSLDGYMGLELAANAYGFPADPSANISSEIADSLSYTTYNIGRLSSVASFYHGEGYSAAPYVRVYEPAIFQTQTPAIITLQLTSSAQGFQSNELISQASTNALGMVIASSGNDLIVRRLSFNNDFSNTTILGESSGATGNVNLKFDAPKNSLAFDLGEYYMGMSADIDSKVVVGNGSVTAIDVTVSGYGFRENEEVVVKNSSNNLVATGMAHLGHSGIGKGFFKTKDGFLSSTKKLQDSYYYQVASYEVRSAVPFETYSDMLNKLLHVAGTRPFGAFYYDAMANSDFSILPAIIKKTVYTARSIGMADGMANVFANAISTNEGVAASTGTGTGQAIGEGNRNYANGVATASGSSNASFVGTPVIQAIANSSDSFAAVFGIGEGRVFQSGVGTANGVATASAISG